MSLASFGAALRGYTTALWRGTIDLLEFKLVMESLIITEYEAAWNEGAAICGLGPADRTVEEQSALNRAILLAAGSIWSLGEFVVANQRGVSQLSVLGPRLLLWTTAYTGLVTLAQTMACSNQRLKWVLGHTVEHCEDCATYNGQVHRASVWRKYGAIPQSRSLECGGWRCQCRLVPTDEPVTPGRPKSPSGITGGTI